jgi:hypothetical protein
VEKGEGEEEGRVEGGRAGGRGAGRGEGRHWTLIIIIIINVIENRDIELFSECDPCLICSESCIAINTECQTYYGGIRIREGSWGRGAIAPPNWTVGGASPLQLHAPFTVFKRF